LRFKLLADDLVQLKLDDAGPQRVDEDLEHLRHVTAGLPHDRNLIF
jgi:hypothetical protein